MTGPSPDIAILMGDDTQHLSVGPFIDLARLSQRAGGGAGDDRNLPVIRTDILSLNARDEAARDIRNYSAVIVPAGDDLSSSQFAPNPDIISRIKAAYDAGAWIGGIGSGTLQILAADIIGDGHAAVPPRHNLLVRRLFPHAITANAQSIAEANRVITVAEAINAPLLALMIASRIHSHGLAERYRRACGAPESALPDRPVFPVRQNKDILVAEARAWIIAHMQDNISTADMAAAFNVSARTLIRHFEKAIGMTPARFLRLVRMEAATSMLMRTRFSVEQVAHLSGFADVGFFRSAFRQHMGRSPRAFRMEAERASSE